MNSAQALTVKLKVTVSRRTVVSVHAVAMVRADTADDSTDAEKTSQVFEAMDADKSGTLDKTEQKKLADKMVRSRYNLGDQ